MTDCNSEQIEFQGLGHRRVVAGFDGGNVTSDSGGLLLREVARGSGILKRFAECFTDFRNPDRIEYPVKDLVSQRVVAQCLGYEDLNDHDRLRHDPLFCTLVDRMSRNGETRLAGKSTLNRLELTRGIVSEDERYKKVVYNRSAIDRLFVDVFLEAHRRAPQEIWLDLDATDTPLHGKQEGRFFHGFYDEYCYMPLYVFCGDFLLSSRLRSSDCDPIEGVVEDLSRMIRQIREKWPNTRIFVRGDSGFSRDELMSWCEQNQVDYVIGLRKNDRLEYSIESDIESAKRKYQKTGEASRRFRSLRYRTRRSWSKARRVVAKAEYLGKSNPRFVVTTIPASERNSRSVYEDLYCARGDMENRLKEQQMGLFANRASTNRMRSNQLRLYFSSIAYVLMNELRRIGLQGTEFASAQCWTIRERLFKIGAVVTISFRRIRLAFSGHYPWQDAFRHCMQNLQLHYS